MGTKSRQEPVKLELGDEVRWSSQAGGYTREKRGTVALVIPAGVALQRAMQSADQHYHVHGDPGLARKHESYLVAVAPKTAKGSVKYYWPVVSNLRKVAKKIDPPGTHYWPDGSRE